MKRRRVLKNLTAALGSALVLPAWAHQWNPATVASEAALLTASEEALLVELVSTLIPEGDIPGAKSLGVHTFIQKMLTDCYEPEAQKDFRTGLESVENTAQQTFQKPFQALTTTQKETVLKKLETSADAKQKDFYASVKNLTIQGYTTSEYVMVNHWRYNMAPGHYYGCVSV